MNKVKRIIRWWLTPKFPQAQINRALSYKPEGLNNFIRDRIRTWLIHPIKRRIARYYLKLLQKFFKITVIGITGSAGKTTTKEMLASILRLNGETVASFANIDPVFNIPTTILRCRPSTKYLILEMGVEYPSEMDFYLWLAQPKVGVITNIYSTHTEFFGNVNGVYKEKSKLIKNLSGDGYAILNSENPFSKKITKDSRAKVTNFGKKGRVRSENIVFTQDLRTKFTLVIGMNRMRIQIPILGKQFVDNALAASAAASCLRISIDRIKRGLESFNPQEHRMSVKRLKSGAVILDDSYNNNPSAAEESLLTFENLARDINKIIVFGDMLELGSLEEKAHRQIGELIAKLKPNYLLCVGSASKMTAAVAGKTLGDGNVAWVKTTGDGIRLLKPYLKRNTVVLVKGSRSIGLEKLISQLS